MGMFDSLHEGTHDALGDEWQTKAYDCDLDVYCVGDTMPDLDGAKTYQVEIGRCRSRWPTHEFQDSLATVVDGALVSIDNERAHTLPLFDYGGHRVVAHELRPGGQPCG